MHTRVRQSEKKCLKCRQSRGDSETREKNKNFYIYINIFGQRLELHLEEIRFKTYQISLYNRFVLTF